MEEETNLLRQVTEAPIGWQEITHKARHLQARHYGDTTTPNLQHSFTTVITAITCAMRCMRCSVRWGIQFNIWCSITAVLTVKAGTSGWPNFVLKEWRRRRWSTSMKDKSPETRQLKFRLKKKHATWNSLSPATLNTINNNTIKSQNKIISLVPLS